MSGTIGIVASDTARWTLFSVCLIQMNHPPNTRVDWALSTDIAGARNTLIERSLEVGSEWILFLDDDHAFPPDLLLRLLKHDKDFVCSLYLRRAQPFAPVAFSGKNEEGLYDSIDLTTMPITGLQRIHAAGGAGMMVKSEVFRAIEYPWFEHGRVVENGEVKWNASEDIIFCEKANAAGFDIWLDPEAQLGHMTPSSVWPSVIDDKWCIGFTVADGLRLYTDISKE